MVAVRAEELVVRYGSFTALAASSFELADATSTALIGANGSGKTTLLHVLAGLIRPSSGRVDIAVVDRVALVAQQHHQHRWMPLSARAVVRMGRYRRTGALRRFRSEDRAAIDAAIERADVGDLLRRPFGELSGGQQQRVRIAQALAGEPELLLLDEPLTGLDPPSQERIGEIIDAELQTGTTVVYSTHHLDEARRAEQVLVLGGSVLSCGPPAEALRADVLAQAFGGRMLVVDRDGVASSAVATADDPFLAPGDVLLVDDHGHDHDGPGAGRDHVAGPDAVGRNG